MKVLIYNNKGKDANEVCLKKLTESLINQSIEYKIIEDKDLSLSYNVDAIFVLGGDGTLLYLNEFVNKNEIPVIGINTGKLGFLSEFERDEVVTSVELLKKGELNKDFRSAIEVVYEGKTYVALNDAFVQRVYTEETGCMVTDVNVSINGIDISNVKGDGIIISTPTGATAYSFSAGGSILAPDVNAFIITPIAAHAFNQRPIVYSADAEYKVTITGRAFVGLFADGKFIGNLQKGESFIVKKAKNQTVFLRRKDFNFFKRLRQKLKKEDGVYND